MHFSSRRSTMDSMNTKLCSGSHRRLWSDPVFGALCVRHARRDACFLVALYTSRDKPGSKAIDYRLFGDHHGWRFLDVNYAVVCKHPWFTCRKRKISMVDNNIHHRKHYEQEVFDTPLPRHPEDCGPRNIIPPPGVILEK